MLKKPFVPEKRGEDRGRHLGAHGEKVGKVKRRMVGIDGTGGSWTEQKIGRRGRLGAGKPLMWIALWTVKPGPRKKGGVEGGRKKIKGDGSVAEKIERTGIDIGVEESMKMKALRTGGGGGIEVRVLLQGAEATETRTETKADYSLLVVNVLGLGHQGGLQRNMGMIQMIYRKTDQEKIT